MGDIRSKLTMIAGVLVVSLLLVALIVGLSRSGNKPGNSSTEIDLSAALDRGDKVKGNVESDILILEYADFQCPACRSFTATIDQLLEEYDGQIAVAYKHFPLLSIHPNANEAAYAAEAALKQDRFWEMHDMLFERQAEWSNLSRGNFESLLEEFAEELDLDVEKFVADYNSDEVRQVMETELQYAEALGLNATPSVFVNGTKISSLSISEIRQAIDQQLEGGSEDE